MFMFILGAFVGLSVAAAAVVVIYLRRPEWLAKFVKEVSEEVKFV